MASAEVNIQRDLIKTFGREFLSVLWEQRLFLLTGRKNAAAVLAALGLSLTTQC